MGSSVHSAVANRLHGLLLASFPSMSLLFSVYTEPLCWDLLRVVFGCVLWSLTPQWTIQCVTEKSYNEYYLVKLNCIICDGQLLRCSKLYMILLNGTRVNTILIRCSLSYYNIVSWLKHTWLVVFVFQQLKQQRDKLKQYQKRIYLQLQKERLLAKQLLKDGKKE